MLSVCQGSRLVLKPWGISRQGARVCQQHAFNGLNSQCKHKKWQLSSKKNGVATSCRYCVSKLCTQVSLFTTFAVKPCQKPIRTVCVESPPPPSPSTVNRTMLLSPGGPETVLSALDGPQWKLELLSLEWLFPSFAVKQHIPFISL